MKLSLIKYVCVEKSKKKLKREKSNSTLSSNRRQPHTKKEKYFSMGTS